MGTGREPGAEVAEKASADAPMGVIFPMKSGASTGNQEANKHGKTKRGVHRIPGRGKKPHRAHDRATGGVHIHGHG